MQHGVGGVGAKLFAALCRSAGSWRVAKPVGVGARGACRGLIDEIGADEVVDRRVAFGLDALEQIAAPGFKVVDPALDLESVAAQLADAKCCGPAVVDQWAHGNLGPLVRAFAVSEQRGGRWQSWPSVKISASTRTWSPTVRFAGKRPPSTSGVDPSMMTRLRPSGVSVRVVVSSLFACLRRGCHSRLRHRQVRGCLLLLLDQLLVKTRSSAAQLLSS